MLQSNPNMLGSFGNDPKLSQVSSNCNLETSRVMFDVVLFCQAIGVILGIGSNFNQTRTGDDAFGSECKS